MHDYQFHFLDAAGRTPTLDFAPADDDAQAIGLACRELARHPSARAVEVFQDRRLVRRIDSSAVSH